METDSSKLANLRKVTFQTIIGPILDSVTAPRLKIKVITVMCSFSGCQQCAHRYYCLVGLVRRSSVTVSFVVVLGLV